MSGANEPDGQAAPDGADLHVDWEQYYALVERLALIVHESGYDFDSLVCLARGGLRAGDVLSRVFDTPLAILATSSYRDEGGTKAGVLEIADTLTTTGDDLWGRVLLVDDLVDSGNTLERVGRFLRANYPAIEEIRSAVIWYKDASSVAPDFYVEHLPHNPWIHQPFERYDRLRPADLAGARSAVPAKK